MENYLLPILIGIICGLITYLFIEIFSYYKQSKYVNNTTGDVFILLGVSKFYKTINDDNTSSIYVLQSTKNAEIVLVNKDLLKECYHKVK